MLLTGLTFIHNALKAVRFAAEELQLPLFALLKATGVFKTCLPIFSNIAATPKSVINVSHSIFEITIF